MHKESESHLKIFQINISLLLSARPPASVMWLTAPELLAAGWSWGYLWLWGRKLCHTRLSRSHTRDRPITLINKWHTETLCRQGVYCVLPSMLQFWPSTGHISRLTADLADTRFWFRSRRCCCSLHSCNTIKPPLDISIMHTAWFYFISPRLFIPGRVQLRLTFLEICITSRNDCAGQVVDTALVLILNVKFTLSHPDTLPQSF